MVLTPACDVRSPPSSHVRLSMRVGQPKGKIYAYHCKTIQVQYFGKTQHTTITT